MDSETNPSRRLQIPITFSIQGIDGWVQSKAARRGAPVVAFQGSYGAYSEAAALDAIPKCQPLPCEHFETAFQVCSFPSKHLQCVPWLENTAYMRRGPLLVSKLCLG